MSIYAAVGLILLAGVGGIVGVLAWMAKDHFADPPIKFVTGIGVQNSEHEYQNSGFM